MTRYYFKVNPGKNGVCDLNIGLHDLLAIENEGKEEWFVEKSWMISMKDGILKQETYKKEIEKNEEVIGHQDGINVKFDNIIMLEIRDKKLALWIDYIEINKEIFTDISGEDIFPCIEFEHSVDDDSIHYLGYDELDE